MNIRPIWRNMILKEYDNSTEPQYSFENNRLTLLNEKAQEGTTHNSGMMNNLMNFDNLISFLDADYTMIETLNGTEETLKDKTTGDIIATRVMTEDSPTKTSIVEKLYDTVVNSFGVPVHTLVQERRITYTETLTGIEASI